MARSSALLIFLLQLSRKGLASADDSCAVVCAKQGNGANSKLFCEDDCAKGLECIADIQPEAGKYEGTCYDTYCNGSPPGRVGNPEAHDSGTFRVTICHRTCSVTNPWVRITIDDDAWYDPNCGHDQHDAQLDCNLDDYNAWGGRTDDYLIKAHGTREEVRTEICKEASFEQDCAALERAYWRNWERACPSVRNGECCEEGECCGDVATSSPSENPTDEPSAAPSKEPTDEPTKQPSSAPSKEPTDEPTKQPSAAPSKEPTDEPTKQPSSAPSKEPTDEPTKQPSSAPSKEPTDEPSQQPSAAPSNDNDFVDVCPTQLSGLGSVCDVTGYLISEDDISNFGIGIAGQCTDTCTSTSIGTGACGSNTDNTCRCFFGTFQIGPGNCNGEKACNCVSSGAFIGSNDGSQTCYGQDTCNYNSGTIGENPLVSGDDGASSCDGLANCNCNSGSILDDACSTGAQSSCNFNSGAISTPYDAGGFTTCEGQYACNFNTDTIVASCDGAGSCNGNDGTIEGPKVCNGPDACNCNTGTIFSDNKSGFEVCKLVGSCNSNTGTISASRDSTEVTEVCGGENSCIFNDGVIKCDNVASNTRCDSCGGLRSCQNIPFCVTINGGCNGEDNCQFPSTTTCCGANAAAATCCTVNTPTGISTTNCQIIASAYSPP